MPSQASASASAKHESTNLPLPPLLYALGRYTAAKMIVMKEVKGNVIMQDVNSDGSARFYTYGTPFFRLIPQTWEDPNVLDDEGHGGDNDPLDVIELGEDVLQMGSVTPCKVLGSLELIDGGETDHKNFVHRRGKQPLQQHPRRQQLHRLLPQRDRGHREVA